MAWREISPADLPAWNTRLLQASSASIRQLPFFNEGLRGAGGLWVTTDRPLTALIAEARRWTTVPRFIVRETPTNQTSFASIVAIGIPGFRVGCILDGPVALHDCPVDKTAIEELIVWARRNHFVAL